MPKKLDQIHDGILKALKKEFPNIDDKELDTRAWAMANTRWAKMQGKESADVEIKEEVKKKRICIAENVPLIISANLRILTKDDE